MICILKVKPGEAVTPPASAEGMIDGWIIATDVHDARRQAYAAGEHDLAGELERREHFELGKHQLTGRYIVLVS